MAEQIANVFVEGWGSVEVVAPPGTSFGIALDDGGRLVITCRPEGREWDADNVPIPGTVRTIPPDQNCFKHERSSVACGMEATR